MGDSLSHLDDLLVQSPFVQFNSYTHSMFAKIRSILGSGSSGKIDSILGSESVFNAVNFFISNGTEARQML